MTVTLKKLEQLLAKATPGKWRTFISCGVVAIMKAGSRRGGGYGEKEVIHWAGFDSSDYPNATEANAALIVALRNAAPHLIAKAREANELRAALLKAAIFIGSLDRTTKGEELYRRLDDLLGGKATSVAMRNGTA